MNFNKEIKILLWLVGFFLLAYFMPLGNQHFNSAVLESLTLVQWYARKHVLLCLVPAFFIAGVIAVFISQAAVIKYFGPTAKKWVAYLVASVSGSILAVCSCTVLPLFSGIHKRGAGLGPAITFLYSGPAINILAIVLTARVLGLQLGLARVIGAVAFSIVIGLLMHFIYQKEEQAKAANTMALTEEEKHPLGSTALHVAALVGILVFATWGQPAAGGDPGLAQLIYHYKWELTALFGLLLAFTLAKVVGVKGRYVLSATVAVIVIALAFRHNPLIPFVAAVVILSLLLALSPGKPQEWLASTWDFTKQIMPLLGLGVLISGFLLGSPDTGSGIIPGRWISSLVGGNSLISNLIASVVGAFMYFATLTEIPILQGLLNNGMGQGPALALLLAGPALSLPNMLVIRRVIGTGKTAVYVSLVVIMATLTGLIYGALA